MRHKRKRLGQEASARFELLLHSATLLETVSEEMGKRVQCAACKLCGGASVKAKSIAIVAHGTSKNKAKQLVEGLI